MSYDLSLKQSKPKISGEIVMSTMAATHNGKVTFFNSYLFLTNPRDVDASVKVISLRFKYKGVKHAIPAIYQPIGVLRANPESDKPFDVSIQDILDHYLKIGNLTIKRGIPTHGFITFSFKNQKIFEDFKNANKYHINITEIGGRTFKIKRSKNNEIEDLDWFYTLTGIRFIPHNYNIESKIQ